MARRFCAVLLCVVMTLDFCVTSYAKAESERFEFTALLAPEMESFATAGEVVKSSNRTTSAALLYFELMLYQEMNDLELENRAFWNDCLIGRSNNLVSVVYDLDGDAILLLVYDTLNGETSAGRTEASMYAARTALEKEGYTVYTVDGEDWTDFFQMILETLKDS